MRLKPHIVILVPRGEVVRNFLYSRTLDVLASEARVTVLSVVDDDRVFASFRNKCEQIIPLEVFPEHRLVRLMRQVLEFSHERYMWSKPAQTRWSKRDVRYGSSLLDQLKWKTKKHAAGLFANPAGLRMLSSLERRLSYVLEPTDRYVRLFRDIKPDLVFNGSHIHSPAAVLPVQAANRLGIKTATFVFSWDNLTSRGRIFLPYDHYLMWNDRMRKQLLDLYPNLCPDQVTVTGTPQFDYYFDSKFHWSREQFCEQVGADPARPIVVYTTGQAHAMPEEPIIVTGIAEMLRGMSDLGPPQLLVRVYAKDNTGRFELLKRQLKDVVFTDVAWDRKWLTPYYDDLFMLTNLIRHADVGINVASTVSLELAMFNKPVINVGYNPSGVDVSPVDYAKYYEFDHYRPVVESGAVRVAYSETEMAAMLRQALSEPNRDATAQKTFIQQMFGDALDGRSGQRVAHCLLGLASPD